MSHPPASPTPASLAGHASLAGCVLLAGCAALTGPPTTSPWPGPIPWAENLAVRDRPHEGAGDDAGPDELALDQDRAVALALAHNPELASLRAELVAATSAVPSRIPALEPQLRIDSGPDRWQGGISDSFEVALRLRPEAPGVVAARAAEAEAEKWAVAARLASAERELTGQVRLALIRLAFAERELDAIGQELAAVTGAAALAHERRARGLTTAVTDELAALERAEMLDALHRARGDRLRHERQLIALLGCDPAVTIRAVLPDREIYSVAGNLDRRALLATALTRRLGDDPSLARISAARARLHRERARGAPWLDYLQIGHDRRGDRRGWSVGLGVTLRLPDGDRIAARRAEVWRWGRESHLQAERVATEVIGTAAMVDRTAERIHALRDELSPSLRRTAALVDAARGSAAVDRADMWRLARARWRARRTLLSAYRVHREAVISLETAVGSVLEPTAFTPQDDLDEPTTHLRPTTPTDPRDPLLDRRGLRLRPSL